MFFFFCFLFFVFCVFFCQAEDGIRDLVRSRGLGDVYKRQVERWETWIKFFTKTALPLSENEILGLIGEIYFLHNVMIPKYGQDVTLESYICLLYTSDAADERSSVDLGGRRIIKKQTIKKKNIKQMHQHSI